MKTTKSSKNHIEIGNGKNVICFDPPAVGKLCKSIITGDCYIIEFNRVVPLNLKQSEKVIKCNFLH